MLGEAYWRTERVPPEFARDFADCVTEYELLGIVREHGFALTGIVRSTEGEFDAYESGIWAACRERLAHAPDDLEVRTYLERLQDEYLGCAVANTSAGRCTSSPVPHDPRRRSWQVPGRGAHDRTEVYSRPVAIQTNP